MTLAKAADKLFDIRQIPDEFLDIEEGRCHPEGGDLRVAIVAAMINERAGHYRGVRGQRCLRGETVLQAATFSQWFAAGVWLKAPIADALGQATRIAATIREV